MLGARKGFGRCAAAVALPACSLGRPAAEACWGRQHSVGGALVGTAILADQRVLTGAAAGVAAPRLAPPSQCIEAAPHLVYGHVAMCISKGRLALFTDNKTKVRPRHGAGRGDASGGVRPPRCSATACGCGCEAGL